MDLPTSPPPAPLPAAQSQALFSDMRPVPVLQKQAYEEAATGKFISLADFEGPPGPLDPQGPISIIGSPGGKLAITVTQTRTGSGALAVELPPGARLVFKTSSQRNFSLYTLLSAAVYVSAPRDDMVVTLVGAKGRWQWHDTLLRAGWNTVMVDLAHLQATGGLDPSDIREISFSFSEQHRPVSFNLDDLLLIDNTRVIPNTPAGTTLRRVGLDYELTCANQLRPIRLAQGKDGLWRLGDSPAILQLGTPSDSLDGQKENIGILGDRHAGDAQLLEANPVRIRLASTWYFPPELGLWRHMDVRQLRWEYTFYGDGRCVTCLRLVNAGGVDVYQVRLVEPQMAAWSDGTIGKTLHITNLNGQGGQWCWLTCANGDSAQDILEAYAHPPRATVLSGTTNIVSAGDADIFDRSQGCYVAQAVGGHCRLSLAISARPLAHPAFRIIAPWEGSIIGSRAGMPIRPIVATDQGALAVLDEVLKNPAVVEFSGKIGLLDR